ncbi:hypothetical protein [uncultured Gammaproteobacteria bacterium]|uniref:SHOCT domain-containing protein n=1 Tax=Bathymodiolus heckerae thiotrophic gill symbiont TaxID=1052212 RepID=UPI0010B944D0|nr:SHOCT domain-containing protein [Bathymodiolus heckerae thiotrophic gill symbiont]CAC9606831.1 hypothetical protein [uncultured Gammaproteobacteria bacterium]SHN91771.1 hypothetical protein BHECKSOX_2193 [Bathymodiolus heckerae thiotrophic gill symbiont]
MSNDGFGMMGLGGGFMWIFWILLIVVIVWMVKESSENKSAFKPSKSALDILKERYAKGDIGKEEFEQKRSDLTE